VLETEWRWLGLLLQSVIGQRQWIYGWQIDTRSFCVFASVALCCYLCTGDTQPGDDDAPAWVKERLLKAEERIKEGDNLKPTHLADIYVYNTKQTNCAEDPANIGSCIPHDEGGYKRELYLCDKQRRLLIAKCLDDQCRRCGKPRLDDYSYHKPWHSKGLAKIGCKDNFLKAMCNETMVDFDTSSPQEQQEL